MAFTYPSLTQVIRTDTFDVWATKTNEIRDHALYVQALVGDFNGLSTDSKTVVGAFNEHETLINTNISNIGPLGSIDIAYAGANLVESLNNAHDVSVAYTDSEVLSEKNSRIDADNGLQQSIDSVELNAGLTPAGQYIQPTTSNYLTTSVSLANADNLLDTKIKEEADILNNTQTNIGTDSSGNITLVGNYITGTIKDSLVALDTQSATNENRISQNIQSIVGLDNRLNKSQTNIGLNSAGVYASDGGNTYAVTDNIKGDINAVDVKLEAVDVSLQSLINEDTNIYNQLALKLETPPTSGDTLIVYDSAAFTYSHATHNPSSVNTNGTEVIDKVIVDSSGHIQSFTKRNLGNQSQHNQTISSNLPSGGSNGDVWYRV